MDAGLFYWLSARGLKRFKSGNFDLLGDCRECI